MLQIGHRESRDVDIFLPDPQFLALLDPKTNDFRFDILPTEYGGDGTGFLKLAFEGLGEIDFIVARTMTASPTLEATVERERVRLETVAEIITKKIVYRGSTIKPRDIFDIAAAAELNQASIVDALSAYPAAVSATLARLDKLNPDFVTVAIAQLAIRDRYRALAPTALARAVALLRSI
uniref:Nucleotidyl transferase AbiEii/AbiGii toxin family protein n=1 Tax=Rhodopseudomonas palustris (strain BisA53) TaxID=316055 RepID=Q07V89_RHOP5